MPLPSAPPQHDFEARDTGLSNWVGDKPERARDLARIVSMLPDVIFKCEKRADGKIYWLLNEGQLAERFGLTTDKVQNKSLEEMFPPDAAARLLEHFERCFAGEAHEFVNELGGRFFKHFPQPIFGKDGNVESVIGFITDVTNLVTAEEEIRRLNLELHDRVADLEGANRQLEAFSYSVSHDLRTPLAVMNSTAYSLRLQLKDADPNVIAGIDRLERGVKRMDALIDDVMSMAKATRGEMHRDPIDLSSLAQEVVAQFRILEPNRAVTALVEPGLTVTGDARLMHVVVENLLSNAWKFTGNKDVAKIEFFAATDRGEKVFGVRDNGVGFDMSRADKIFNPFERLHRSDEFAGTGVGLATVRRIICAHGGEITVESAPGVGTTFYFSVAPTEREKRDSSPSPAEAE